MAASVVMRVPPELEPYIRKAIATYKKRKVVSDRKIAGVIGKELIKRIA